VTACLFRPLFRVAWYLAAHHVSSNGTAGDKEKNLPPENKVARKSDRVATTDALMAHITSNRCSMPHWASELALRELMACSSSVRISKFFTLDFRSSVQGNRKAWGLSRFSPL